MTTEARLRGMIGLASRAGKLSAGEEAVIRLIRSGKAAIALIDESASENAKKKIRDACIYCHVPLAEITENLLESSSGKTGRMAIALPFGGFATQMAEILSHGGAGASRIVYNPNKTTQNAGVQAANDKG